MPARNRPRSVPLCGYGSVPTEYVGGLIIPPMACGPARLDLEGSEWELGKAGFHQAWTPGPRGKIRNKKTLDAIYVPLDWGTDVGTYRSKRKFTLSPPNDFTVPSITF